jgi:uncharacterized membrane protein
MDKKLYWASIVSAIIGLLVSIYMTIYKLTANDAMCLGSGDCSTVNASRYSEIYGIPVALLGVAGFLAILFVHFMENRKNPFFLEQGTLMVFAMSLFGFVFSLYLTYLELYVIHAVCPFCVASAVAITIVFIVGIIRLVKTQPE